MMSAPTPDSPSPFMPLTPTTGELPKVSAINPFLADVCATPFEVGVERSVEELNREAVQRVSTAVEHMHATREKPVLMVSAPRAGYGKTHLLGRVALTAQANTMAMPVVFRSDAEVSWPAVSKEAMSALALLPSRHVGWTRLREASAGAFAALVVHLIKDGRLPCANREQAMRVLSQEPTDLFRDGTQAKLIGDWLRKHYQQLRRALGDHARALPGAVNADAWVDAIFAYASHGSATSCETVVELGSASREAFCFWLRMVAHWRPVMLFVDHLDGFYRMEQQGLRIATMLLDFTAIDDVHVVLSMNQDVWQATFAHHLPSAVEDRLTAAQVLLRGLTAEDATAMLRLRMRSARIDLDTMNSFVRFVQVERYLEARPEGSLSARSFLRHAALQWQRFTDIRARGEDPVAIAAEHEAKAELANEESPSADLPEMPGEGPMIFADHEKSLVAAAAESLSEPKHAMVDTPFAIAAQNLIAEPSLVLTEPSSPFAIADAEPPVEASIMDPISPFVIADVEPPQPSPIVASLSPFAIADAEPPQAPPVVASLSPFAIADAEPPQPPSILSPFTITSEIKAEPPAIEWKSLSELPPAPPAQPASPGAMEHLREMMDRLRKQGPILNSVEAAAAAAAALPLVQAIEAPATPPPLPIAPPPGADIQKVFHDWRKEAGDEAHGPLNRERLSELIALAGKRFPLVKYDSIVLPGSGDHTLQRWTLSDVEILFAMRDFTDTAYWRAVAPFASGRLAELQSTNGSSLKLLTVRSENEPPNWGTVVDDASVFPEMLRGQLEIMQLDARSIAALYAMQRVVSETEAGRLQAPGTQVMSVLARELDFFWKRVTKPLPKR
jgi:hypothetical protein